MPLPKCIQHIGYCAAYLPGEFIFKKLCSLTVEGREHVIHRKNVLFVSNHKTLIDNWLITCATFGTKVTTNWNLTPYHPAAVENFLNTPMKKLVFGDFLKCIPVDRQKFDMQGLDAMVKKLQTGTMITFPEGTRTRSGRVGRHAKIGVGYLIYKAKPIVIPVYHTGTEKILPVGAHKLSFGHKLSVKIGPQLDMKTFYQMPDEKNTWEQIAQYALQSIAALEKEVLS